MIRTIIADDEPPILRGLKKTIESQHPDFQVVACARDGRSAIQLVQQHRPDVVLTDIRMPIKDGIEVLEYLRRYEPQIQVVVISGHQEFDYARKALQCQAVDYLLKPVSLQEVRNLLERIAAVFYERSRQREAQYFARLIDRESPEMPVPPSLSQYVGFGVMLSCLGPFPIGPTIITSNDCIQKIRRQFIQAAQGYEDRVWDVRGRTALEHILIVGAVHATSSQALEELNHVHHQLTETPSTLPVTSVVSTAPISLHALHNTVNACRVLLRKHVKIGVSQLLYFPEDTGQATASQHYLRTIASAREKVFHHAFQQVDQRVFQQELQSLLREWERGDYPQVIVEKNLKYLATCCQRLVALPNETDSNYIEMEMNEAIGASMNYAMLFERVWSIFERLFLQVQHESQAENFTTRQMQKIEGYMHANFSEALDTPMLAEKVGLVPSYVSQLFRRYKGMTPTQYLIHLRLEKAKELMRTRPDLRLKEIAALVGYDNPYYFSRIFKQKIGIGPSEYKAREQEA